MRFHLSVLAILISVLTGGLGCDDPLLVCTNFPDDPICGGNHNPPDDDPPQNNNQAIVWSELWAESPNNGFSVPGRNRVTLLGVKVRWQNEPIDIEALTVQVRGRVNPDHITNMTATSFVQDDVGNDPENDEDQLFVIEGDTLNPQDLDNARSHSFYLSVNIHPEADVDTDITLCLTSIRWRGRQSGIVAETPVETCGHLHHIVAQSPVEILRTPGMNPWQVVGGFDIPLLCLDITSMAGNFMVTDLWGWTNPQNGAERVETVTLTAPPMTLASSDTERRWRFFTEEDGIINAGATKTFCVVANEIENGGVQETCLEGIRGINLITGIPTELQPALDLRNQRSSTCNTVTVGE